MAGIFLTGTDTEVGKTHVACALLNAIIKQNIKAVGMKPVASGADHERLQNDDAIKLMQASSIQLSYDLINPYCFKTPTSPHIAASLEQQNINLDKIVDSYKVIEQQAEFIVVEGVGGWLAPLNDKETVESMAIALQLPVVLVVGMRLGCLNHSLLSAERIQQSGLKLAGWVANCTDENMAFLEENINTLTERINAPLIGQLNYAENFFNEDFDKGISLLVNT